MAHRVDGERRMWRCLVRLAVLVLHHPAADQTAHLGVDKILAGEDVDDARKLFRRRNVDALDLRMRMRRTQEIRVGRPGEGQIVDIATGAGQEATVYGRQGY